MAYNNTDNTFVALIDQNGYIRDMSTGRRGEVIGIDYQKEEEYKATIAEMQETLDNYYNKLVELGAITIPKTPEQIAQEAAAEQVRIAQEQAEQQATINQALLQAIEGLSTELKELKESGNSGHCSGACSKQSGSDSKSDGQTGKSGKGSSATGTKDAT